MTDLSRTDADPITREQAAALIIESNPGIQHGSIVKEIGCQFTASRGKLASIQEPLTERWYVRGYFPGWNLPLVGRSRTLRKAIEALRAAVAWRRDREARR